MGWIHPIQIHPSFAWTCGLSRGSKGLKVAVEWCFTKVHGNCSNPTMCSTCSGEIYHPKKVNKNPKKGQTFKHGQLWSNPSTSKNFPCLETSQLPFLIWLPGRRKNGIGRRNLRGGRRGQACETPNFPCFMGLYKVINVTQPVYVHYIEIITTVTISYYETH